MERGRGAEGCAVCWCREKPPVCLPACLPLAHTLHFSFTRIQTEKCTYTTSTCGEREPCFSVRGFLFSQPFPLTYSTYRCQTLHALAPIRKPLGQATPMLQLMPENSNFLFTQSSLRALSSLSALLQRPVPDSSHSNHGIYDLGLATRVSHTTWPDFRGCL